MPCVEAETNVVEDSMVQWKEYRRGSDRSELQSRLCCLNLFILIDPKFPQSQSGDK